MAREFNRLSPGKVATTTKPGLHADGGGLCLRVSTGGTKSWVFRFMLDGKARTMGLGSVRTVSLAEAREEALRCRKLLREGIDPIDARGAERAQRRLRAASTKTFKVCAEKYVASHEAGWRNAKHAAQWRNTLEAYVYPVFGDLPVQAVDTGLVMRVLEPVWRTKPETASRVRGRIESILDWARVQKYREGENPARWKGHLDKLLPARSKVRKVKHHAALPYAYMGAFMATLRRQEGASALGLELQILTATRTGEVIGARWEEIDLDEKTWTVPGDRTKTHKEHRVPLSPAAVGVLESMKEQRQSEFVFPGRREGRHLSNMAFLQLLKRMERPDLTAHGFRSSFRDWAAERTNFPGEVVEMALAHVVAGKVEAAYRRGDLFEKRRKLMEGWAEYCGVKPAAAEGAGKVVAIGRPAS